MAGCGAQSAASDSQKAEPAAAPAAAAADIANVEPGAVMLADGTTPSALMTVEVEPGHNVSFYETEPGVLSIVELAMPGQQMLVGEGTDAMELFSQIAPGAAAPAELLAAYDRAKANAALAVPNTVSQGNSSSSQLPEVNEAVIDPGANFEAVGQALVSSSNCASFVDDSEACDWASAYSACRCNWSGGFFAQAGSASSMSIIVDHYSGNGVTIRLLKDGVVTLSVGVPAGQIGSLNSSGSSAVRRCEVTNASGDAFHASCMFGL
jgi:hypothetical protein